MPKDIVEYMRDKFMEGKFKDDYHMFDQELFDRMSQKKQDEEHKKNLHQVTRPDEKTKTVAAVDTETSKFENVQV